MEVNKIEIYSIHYNRPEYLTLQIDSFKKFINIEYSFNVIDNSIDSNVSKSIYDICYNNNINYLKSNNETPHGSMYYGWSHLHGLEYFKKLIILVPYKQPITDSYSCEGGAGHVFYFDDDSFTNYKLHDSYTFSTAGWQYSSKGETPLQLCVCISKKEYV